MITFQPFGFRRTLEDKGSRRLDCKIKHWFWCSDNDIVSPVLQFTPLFSCKQQRLEQKPEEHMNINRTETIICEEAASIQLGRDYKILDEDLVLLVFWSEV